MSVIQVGLVDTTGEMDSELVQATAAALNIQVTRDLPQYWNISATVRALPGPDAIPVGVWPVRLVRHLPPGEGGIHLDKHNQPFSLVIATPDSDQWTIDASHETIEMLVDPAGNRLQSSRSIEISGRDIQDGPSEFEYLVEACDPCEASGLAYSIQGIAVSDFITPHFYDPVATSGTRYSFAGNIKVPRQILPGGYISFVNPELDEMQQILFLGATPELRTLGPAEGGSLRMWVDRLTSSKVLERREENKKLLAECRARREHLRRGARQRASTYRTGSIAGGR